MTDKEVIGRVDRQTPLRPKLPPRPRPHPSMNPGGFMNGRGVYEVEEDMLALYSQLSEQRWKRLFQWQRWRLWFMWHQYYPMSVKSVLAKRREYLRSLDG